MNRSVSGLREYQEGDRANKDCAVFVRPTSHFLAVTYSWYFVLLVAMANFFMLLFALVRVYPIRVDLVGRCLFFVPVSRSYNLLSDATYFLLGGVFILFGLGGVFVKPVRPARAFFIKRYLKLTATENGAVLLWCMSSVTLASLDENASLWRSVLDALVRILVFIVANSVVQFGAFMSPLLSQAARRASLSAVPCAIAFLFVWRFSEFARSGRVACASEARLWASGFVGLAKDVDDFFAASVIINYLKIMVRKVQKLQVPNYTFAPNYFLTIRPDMPALQVVTPDKE